MGALPRIEMLLLYHNDIGDAGVSALAGACASGAIALTVLYLGGNKVSVKGLERLMPSLKAASLLRELWLGNNPLADVGMKKLAPLLAEMRMLEELWRRRAWQKSRARPPPSVQTRLSLLTASRS